MRDVACRDFGINPFVLCHTRNYAPKFSCIGYNNPTVLIPDSLIEADEEILQARMYAQAAAISAGHHKLTFFIWVL